MTENAEKSTHHSIIGHIMDIPTKVKKNIDAVDAYFHTAGIKNTPQNGMVKNDNTKSSIEIQPK
jgi:hypothetical protein